MRSARAMALSNIRKVHQLSTKDLTPLFFWGTQTKMIVIPHETPPKHFDSPALVDLPNRVKKHLPILFTNKDFVPKASTVHDVIDSSGVLNAKCPSHGTVEYQKGHQLSTKDLTPLGLVKQQAVLPHGSPVYPSPPFLPIVHKGFCK